SQSVSITSHSSRGRSRNARPPHAVQLPASDSAAVASGSTPRAGAGAADSAGQGSASAGPGTIGFAGDLRTPGAHGRGAGRTSPAAPASSSPSGGVDAGTSSPGG